MSSEGRPRFSTFRSLRNHNYRLYLAGQLVSQAGTLMQNVAQGWLVLKLSGSGAAVGLVVALQYLPVLVLGGPFGVLVDRFDRRRLLATTQLLGCIEASLIGVLVVTGWVELWMVFVFAGVFGSVNALDQPTRNTLVLDLVGPDDLVNAISLNMALINCSRVIGPALAGLTIAVLGIGPCFLLNAASYGALILALALMRPSEIEAPVLRRRASGQFRAGLRYVGDTPEILGVIALATVLGVAWQTEVEFLLMVKFAFGGGAAAYALLLSGAAGGSVAGAIAAAHYGDMSIRGLRRSTILLGLGHIGAALAPILALEVIAATIMGFAFTFFASSCSSRLQLRSDPSMRGRMTALWVSLGIGFRPGGSLLAGLIGDHIGPRFALGASAAVIVSAGLPIITRLSRLPGRTVSSGPALAGEPLPHWARQRPESSGASVGRSLPSARAVGQRRGRLLLGRRTGGVI